MRSTISFQAILATLLGAASASDDPTTTYTACTASSTSGAFYDLRADIAAKPPADGSKPEYAHAPTEDYHVRGHDYGRNFTLNICAPVVDTPPEVSGLKEELWANVSAYYTFKGETYSVGLASGNLTARGKELVLQYTGGSPCGKKKSKRTSMSGGIRRLRGAVHEGAMYRDYEEDEDRGEDKSSPRNETDSGSSEEKYDNGDDDDDDDDNGSYEKKDDRRKSATIFFSCDRDPTADAATTSFIATDPEECHYIFKVRSQHSCAGAEPHKPGSVGPWSVFLIILSIAILVYLLGGIFYNRTVSNARGWKQLPNYTLWASLWIVITVSFYSPSFLLALPRFLLGPEAI